MTGREKQTETGLKDREAVNPVAELNRLDAERKKTPREKLDDAQADAENMGEEYFELILETASVFGNPANGERGSLGVAIDNFAVADWGEELATERNQVTEQVAELHRIGNQWLQDSVGKAENSSDSDDVSEDEFNPEESYEQIIYVAAEAGRMIDLLRKKGSETIVKSTEFTELDDAITDGISVFERLNFSYDTLARKMKIVRGLWDEVEGRKEELEG